MRYLEFLSRLHDVLDPGTYLEVGVRNGNSLSLARCPSVGIDPEFTLTAELAAPVWLYRTTSDEYFERPDALAPLEGRPVDLAFIDGMHLFEFALRDFINVERHSAPWTVVVFDDMFPRRVDEAARVRHSKAWTGDIYKVIEVFRARRPDLELTFVNTTPTGLLLIHGLDASNTVLSDQYDEIVATTVRDDPQVVPESILKREGALTPPVALGLDVWGELRAARPGGGTDAARRAALAPRNPLKGPLDMVGAQPAAATPTQPPSFALRARRSLVRRTKKALSGTRR
ncbi:MAG: class I SAM-dependent methyltransferase [Actinomycetes bacterium]